MGADDVDVSAALWTASLKQVRSESINEQYARAFVERGERVRAKKESPDWPMFAAGDFLDAAIFRVLDRALSERTRLADALKAVEGGYEAALAVVQGLPHPLTWEELRGAWPVSMW